MTEKIEPLNLLRKAFTHPLTNAWTLWLFTCNDIQSMIAPNVAFAFYTGTGLHHITISTFLRRLPKILVWLWVNLLAFNVNNQRHWRSIREDKINKPFRPIPSGRIHHDEAKILGPLTYALAVIVSFALGGGTIESSLLVLFDWLYSDRHFGDKPWETRQILNGLGISSFASGALSVALQSRVPVRAFCWLCIIVTMLSTTVEFQDLYDEEGDEAAGRETIPLVIGDEPTRWTLAGAMTFWSIVAPLYWGGHIGSMSFIVILGEIVTLRCLRKRSVPEDKMTYRLYLFWVACLYALPFMAAEKVAW